MAAPNPPQMIPEKEEKMKTKLFKLAMGREWAKVVRMYEKYSMAHTFSITKSMDTALHVAVSDGKEKEVEQMVELIKKGTTTQALQMKNVDGNTPLHVAAAVGSGRMCKVIGEADHSGVEIRNDDGETPFFLAAACGKKDAFLMLHSFRKNIVNHPNYNNNCRRKDGETILHCAIDGEHLDLAFQIIHLYGDLVTWNNKIGLSPLHYLAMRPTLFRSGVHIRILNQIVYHCTSVDEPTTGAQSEAVDSNCPDTYKTFYQFYRLLMDSVRGVISNINICNTKQADAEDPSGGGQSAEKKRLVPHHYATCFDFAKLVAKAMLIIFGLGTREVNKMKHKKQKHTWSIQIMKLLVQKTSSEEYESTGENPREEKGTEEHKDSPYFYLEVKEKFASSDGVKPGKKSKGAKKTETAFLLAAKNGVTEIMKEILNRFPVAINDTNEDKKNAVLLAVENRQPRVYELLLEKDFLKEVVFRKVDREGNSALHLAAKQVSSDSLWMIPGAAFQMQWEIKWYEYIRDSKGEHYFPRHNKKGESPREIFDKTHANLLNNAGKWLTKTSESCSVVAALVATVAFATAATVPGGNDQEKGTPLLGNQPVFDLFAIGSLFALGFSITSLVMFLAILTSRYEVKDFRHGLPWKLLLGLSSLFLSIGAMLVSFCAGHFFVLKDNLKYAAFPIYVLTCLPLSLFAAAQFPLYIDLIRATFMEIPLRSYTKVADYTKSADEDTAKEMIAKWDTTKEIILKWETAKEMIAQWGTAIEMIAKWGTAIENIAKWDTAIEMIAKRQPEQ